MRYEVTNNDFRPKAFKVPGGFVEVLPGKTETVELPEAPEGIEGIESKEAETVAKKTPSAKPAA